MCNQFTGFLGRYIFSARPAEFPSPDLSDEYKWHSLLFVIRDLEVAAKGTNAERVALIKS